jgi:hypothetical protein
MVSMIRRTGVRAGAGLHLAFSSLPLLLPAWGLFLSLLARVKLGHWPVPCQDDPYSVLGPALQASWMTAIGVVLVGWVGWFPLTLLLWPFLPARGHLRRVLLFAACSLAAYVALRATLLCDLNWLNAFD